MNCKHATKDFPFGCGVGGGRVANVHQPLEDVVVVRLPAHGIDDRLGLVPREVEAHKILNGLLPLSAVQPAGDNGAAFVLQITDYALDQVLFCGLKLSPSVPVDIPGSWVEPVSRVLGVLC